MKTIKIECKKLIKNDLGLGLEQDVQELSYKHSTKGLQKALVEKLSVG